MDQAGYLREMKARAGRTPGDEARRRVRVISVTSGKGGVGKTNITVNLAYLLSRRKKRILLLDADMGLANVDVVLGLTPKVNLFHVLSGEKSLQEVMIEGPGGIKILPAASGIQEMSSLSRGQKLTLLDELQTATREVDFLLIDTAAGIAGNVMYFNMAASEIIVVASPEPTSLTDAYAVIKVLFQRHAKRHFRLLVNMVRDAREAAEVYQRLNEATDRFLNLQIGFFGHVLRDERLPDAVKQQKALAALYPESPANRCLAALAEKLCREEPAARDEGGISFFWERIIERDCG